MTQYGFYFDSTRCTGCKTCELACKDYKDLGSNIAFRKVYDYEGGTWTDQGDGSFTQDSFAYHVSLACQHCNNPACVQVCPTGAMHKDEATGLVNSTRDVCIGCGSCVDACPYGVPTVDRMIGKSVKCDGCADRVAAGLDPICVGSCPLRALDFGPVDELIERHGGADVLTQGIAPMPDPSLTDPNTYVLACPAAREPGDTTGAIANVAEVTNRG